MGYDFSLAPAEKSAHEVPESGAATSRRDSPA